MKMCLLFVVHLSASSLIYLSLSFSAARQVLSSACTRRGRIKNSLVRGMVRSRPGVQDVARRTPSVASFCRTHVMSRYLCPSCGSATCLGHGRGWARHLLDEQLEHRGLERVLVVDAAISCVMSRNVSGATAHVPGAFSPNSTVRVHGLDMHDAVSLAVAHVAIAGDRSRSTSMALEVITDGCVAI